MRLRGIGGIEPKSAGRRAFCFSPVAIPRANMPAASPPGSFPAIASLLPLLAIAILLLVCGPALAAAAPYDIMVMVAATGDKPPQVAISYASATDQSALRAGIETLGKRAHCRPEQVVIRDAPLARQVAAPGTDAQFLAPGMIDTSGRLPVGPIVRSLPNWSHMRLVFLLPPNYPFAGPGDVTADGLAVRLVNRVATYEYDVERISEEPSPASVAGGPTAGAKGAGKKAAPSAAAEASRQVLPAALIGLPSGLLVGWLLYGWRGRRSRARRAGGARPDGSEAAATGKSGESERRA